MSRVLDDRSVKITAKVEEQYEQILAYWGVGVSSFFPFFSFFYFFFFLLIVLEGEGGVS